MTTQSPQGALNAAPMGPLVDAGLTRFVLKPFKTSTTYQNLITTRDCVFHVVDDALLLARAAIGVDPEAVARPATRVRGSILECACRFFELRISSIEDHPQRVTMNAEVLARGTQRDFFGWNRAKHSVLELAILATRVHLTPRAEILAEFERNRAIVEKTGGPGELRAFDLLHHYVIAWFDNHPAMQAPS